MNKAFEKILERLEEDARFYNSASDVDQNIRSGLIIAKEAVQEVAEQYNNGWIPCSSGVMPRANGWYLVTNHLGVVQEQRWSANHWEKLRDDAVLAWRELPYPYQPKGE